MGVFSRDYGNDVDDHSQSLPVDMWTAEGCLYTNECKPGSFLLFLAAASLWKSQETFSALIMHWNVAQRELPVSE